MRRDEYVADERVAGFTRWARQLATENLKLEDRGTNRGTVFCCASLYDTLEKHRWPNNRYSLDYRAPAQKLGARGLAVLRPAMTILLRPERRGFAQADYGSLQLHYNERVRQIHLMSEHAQHGLGPTADHLKFAMDYRDQTNVLAGPGSGKTRVLVHRIAHLVRVRRENPRGILALAFNRHATVEIRRRLADLIGNDARGVTVLTCHGMAMRLVGASFAGRSNRLEQDDFHEVMRQAVALLRGQGLPPEEADEHRERLLAGFRWILVDEYQDGAPRNVA